MNGQQYAIPYSVGVVGFWYNKDLFAKAGISSPPKTWPQFLADVAKLKTAGITPDRDRRQGPLAGRVLLGLPRDEALQQGDDAAFGGHLQLQGSMLAQGG